MLPDLACFKARRIHRSILAGKFEFSQSCQWNEGSKRRIFGVLSPGIIIHLLEKSPFWAVLGDSPCSLPVLQQDPFGGGMDPAGKCLGRNETRYLGLGGKLAVSMEIPADPGPVALAFPGAGLCGCCRSQAHSQRVP